MMRLSKRIRFRWALGVSVCLHVLMLSYFSLPAVNFSPAVSPLNPVEVTYQEIRHEARPRPASARNSPREEGISAAPMKLPEIQKFISQSSSDFAEHREVMDRRPGEPASLTRNRQPSSAAEVQLVKSKPRVSIPFLESEKIENPQYLDYNQTIRQRIKERAYLYVHDPQFENGYVYLTFILAANGNVQDLKINDYLTSANSFLRDVGLRSIRESNPFPPFPRDLSYPELTFNVAITFEER